MNYLKYNTYYYIILYNILYYIIWLKRENEYVRKESKVLKGIKKKKKKKRKKKEQSV